MLQNCSSTMACRQRVSIYVWCNACNWYVHAVCGTLHVQHWLSASPAHPPSQRQCRHQSPPQSPHSRLPPPASAQSDPPRCWSCRWRCWQRGPHAPALASPPASASAWAGSRPAGRVHGAAGGKHGQALDITSWLGCTHSSAVALHLSNRRNRKAGVPALPASKQAVPPPPLRAPS